MLVAHAVRRAASFMIPPRVRHPHTLPVVGVASLERTLSAAGKTATSKKWTRRNEQKSHTRTPRAAEGLASGRFQLRVMPEDSGQRNCGRMASPKCERETQSVAASKARRVCRRPAAHY